MQRYHNIDRVHLYFLKAGGLYRLFQNANNLESSGTSLGRCAGFFFCSDFTFILRSSGRIIYIPSLYSIMNVEKRTAMEIRLEQIAKSFDKRQVIQPTTLTMWSNMPRRRPSITIPPASSWHALWESPTGSAKRRCSVRKLSHKRQ